MLYDYVIYLQHKILQFNRFVLIDYDSSDLASILSQKDNWYLQAVNS